MTEERPVFPLAAKIGIAVVVCSIVLATIAAIYQVRQQQAAELAKHKENFVTWSVEAEQGDASAQFNLGVMYTYGHAVEKNPVLARELYLKAAAQDLDVAHHALGMMSKDGFGVAQDYQEAMKWFKSAAALGNHFAELEIGNFYREGKGVEADIKMAADYYLKAAKANVVGAQLNMGSLHLMGAGVEQDNIMSFAWLAVAALNGSEKAKDILQANHQDMSSDDLFIAKGKTVEILRELGAFTDGEVTDE